MKDGEQAVVVAMVETVGLMEGAGLKSRFHEDLKFDSLDMAELAIGLEERFDVALPDEEVHKWATVQDAINSVGRALEAK